MAHRYGQAWRLEKEQEKTATGNRYRQDSRLSQVVTKDRINDSSPGLNRYPPSGAREKSRLTSPVVTDILRRLRPGTSPAEKPLNTESVKEYRQGSGLHQVVADILRPGTSPAEKPFIAKLATCTVPSPKKHGDLISTESVYSRKSPPVIQSSETSFATNVPSMAQGKAIPLCLPNNLSWDPNTGEIHKNRDTRCFLYPVPAAINVLKAIKEPVCVVSIVGPCRDGKSYVLGEVFGEKDVFSIGHEMDPETMGLWMWIVPQKFKDSHGRDFTVILLDSEGINAVTAEGQNDNQIFTLTVLLASVLIYNSKGVPKRNDLNDLNFIVKLSQRIRIQSKDGHDDQELFRNTFPFFIWLLRDVAQKLPSDCRDINQYFSTRVFKESAANTASDEKGHQTITEGILNLFSGFEAFALPAPSSDDDIMQDISNSRDKLNPKFLEGLKRFESLLKSKLASKPSINKGEKVTGEALGALVKLYTDAINDPDAVPNVETAWDTYVKTKCSEAKKEALKFYDEAMTQRISPRLPCEVHEILKNHKIFQSKSMQKFEAQTAELISTNIDKDLNELMESIDKKVNTWKDKNASLTRQYSEELLRQLKARYLDPVLKRVSNRYDTSVSYADIKNGWDYIVDSFHRKAVGAKDVIANVLFNFNKVKEI
ncbi:hypothetical protein OS493_004501 [Desmophyllum pertusum]|uniref:GB1/RHD3-type G domain-containing protein n=1 Tax=Desmophyllum pertusum TaxID=174260 RepID=A0A9W9ZG70_9CNID|nr:hypothetical protein OS493_004501 [Desmophyllum pertusum]